MDENLLEKLGDYPGETPRAKRALIYYAQMGSRRSLARCAETGPVHRLQTLKNWSRANEWQARVAAFDAAVYEQELNEWSLSRRELRERDWQEGLIIRDRAFEIIQSQLNNARLSQLAAGTALLMQLTNLQRLGALEPGQYVSLSGSALDDFIDAQPWLPPGSAGGACSGRRS